MGGDGSGEESGRGPYQTKLMCEFHVKNQASLCEDKVNLG